jgi:hypothetical protein
VCYYEHSEDNTCPLRKQGAGAICLWSSLTSAPD